MKRYLVSHSVAWSLACRDAVNATATHLTYFGVLVPLNLAGIMTLIANTARTTHPAKPFACLVNCTQTAIAAVATPQVKLPPD